MADPRHKALAGRRPKAGRFALNAWVAKCYAQTNQSSHRLSELFLLTMLIDKLFT